MNANCDLCGLSLRHGTFVSVLSGKKFRFCCMGCKKVFHMLMEASGDAGPETFKETELFKKCQELGIIPSSEGDLAGTAQTASAESPHADADTGGEKGGGKEVPVGALSLDLGISDMWCPSCAWVIEESLKRERGVVGAVCNFSTDRVRCIYDPSLTAPGKIVRAIKNLGYRASVPREASDAGDKRREFIRFAVSAFLTLNVMMLSFALYSGFFTDLPADSITMLSWPIFLMASVVLFYGGRRIYQRAFTGIFSAGFGMEALITAGAFSAYLYSTFNLLTGTIHLYFDTASMLITLVLLGKTLEARAKNEIQEELGNFFSLRPKKVRICSEQFPEGRYVAMEQLQSGDVFKVEESEILPADGVIFEGKGAIDESSLTGEALPVNKKEGGRLRSGTRVLRGTFKVRAEAAGKDSTLGQMIAIMEKALGTRTPLEGKTDIALHWFVPVIFALAAGTGVVCYIYGLSAGEAILRSVTVMVISCPCSLGLAIPLARVAGISVAGKKGILVRDFSSFERADRLDAFVFDKTGTVTKGQWALLEVIPFESFGEEEVLSLAAGLEKDSDHPIGVEIKRWASKRRVKTAQVDRLRVFENGISGYAGGDEVKIGSRDFVEDEITESKYRTEENTEHSHVFMSLGGRLRAIFVFGDQLKEDSRVTIEKLRKMGYLTALISGDGEKTTRAIGLKIGAEVSRGGKLPKDKVAFIQELQKQCHRVAMVGDGINDAPALAQADLAIAVPSGSHLDKEAADITLMRGEPGQIPVFLALTRRVNRKVNQNLVYTFLYNVISIPIAMSGLLTPLVAVCAMLLSSLSVTGNTLLLMRRSS